MSGIDVDIDSECDWIESKVSLIHNGIEALAELAAEEEEAELSAQQALAALRTLGDRARALACLAEAVEQAACHKGGTPACVIVSQMARRARYLADVGFKEPQTH